MAYLNLTSTSTISPAGLTTGFTNTFTLRVTASDSSIRTFNSATAVAVAVRRKSDKLVMWGAVNSSTDKVQVRDDTSGWSSATAFVPPPSGYASWAAWISANTDSGSTTRNHTFAYGGSSLASGVEYEWMAVAWGAHSGGNSIPEYTDWEAFTLNSTGAPTATLLSPGASDSASPAQIATNTPVLDFRFSDPASSSSDPVGSRFDAFQIEVYDNANNAVMLRTATLSTTSGEKSARRVQIAYGSTRLGSITALVSGDTYWWRARVIDGSGLSSDWTAPLYFTVVTQPDVPTDITPSGLQRSDTPTISGTYVIGSGVAESGYQYQIRSGSTTIYDSGFVSGAIATGQVYGTNNASDTPATPPALQWGGSYEIRMRSRDAASADSAWSDWQAFNLDAPPSAPLTLDPPDGAYIGDTTPTLSWTHIDADNDGQQKVWIELYDEGNVAVTGYASPGKELTQPQQSHTVTETLLASPATEYRHRIRTEATPGPGPGPYSAWRRFTVADVPTVSITSPVNGATLSGSGATVTWTFAGGSGVQGSYQVIVYQAGTTVIAHDSGLTAGTDTSSTIPTGTMANGSSYDILVIVEDSNGLEGQSGRITVDVVYTASATVTGVAVDLYGGDADSALPVAVVSWDQSDLAVSQFLGYRVYRRRVGDDDWRLLDEISGIGQLTYPDFSFESGVTQEWTVTQLEYREGQSIESAYATAAQGELTWTKLFLHDVRNPTNFVALDAGRLDTAIPAMVEKLQPWDQRAPVAHFGPASPQSAAFAVRDVWEDRTTWNRLVSLLRGQSADQVVLMARQERDVTMYCALDAIDASHEPALYDVRLTLSEITYREGL